MKALTSKGRIDLDYFVMLIRGCEKRLLQAWTKQGATVESVEHQLLANTSVPLPSLDEQSQIVEAMGVKTAPLTSAISRLEREITLLREYRTRLVADVVTGKLDVRAAAALLPDEAPLDDTAASPDPDDDLPIEEEDDA
jgi:type I restriction enzyme S subunit